MKREIRERKRGKRENKGERVFFFPLFVLWMESPIRHGVASGCRGCDGTAQETQIDGRR